MQRKELPRININLIQEKKHTEKTRKGGDRQTGLCRGGDKKRIIRRSKVSQQISKDLTKPNRKLQFIHEDEVSYAKKKKRS